MKILFIVVQVTCIERDAQTNIPQKEADGFWYKRGQVWRRLTFLVAARWPENYNNKVQ
jgi:hypothetical protein